MPVDSNSEDEILPYNILVSDKAPVKVNEGECEHTARMQNAVTTAQDIEFELSDGSSVSLDPHTLQMIINKGKCVDAYKHLDNVKSFGHFLGGVYDRAEVHDHSGDGPVSEEETSDLKEFLTSLAIASLDESVRKVGQSTKNKRLAGRRAFVNRIRDGKVQIRHMVS